MNGQVIKDVVILNPYNEKEFQDDKLSIIDINIVYTLQTGREGIPYRLSILAQSIDELIQKLFTIGFYKTFSAKRFVKNSNTCSQS